MYSIWHGGSVGDLFADKSARGKTVQVVADRGAFADYAAGLNIVPEGCPTKIGVILNETIFLTYRIVVRLARN